MVDGTFPDNSIDVKFCINNPNLRMVLMLINVQPLMCAQCRWTTPQVEDLVDRLAQIMGV
jgi:hypothetical protein